MFHLGSYWLFRRIQCIPRFGEFYKNVGNLLGGLTDCEELVVVTLT